MAAAPVRVVTPGKTLVNNHLNNQLKPTNGLVRGAVVAVSPRQSPAILPKKLPAGTVTTAAAAKLSPQQVAALRAGGGSVTITQSGIKREKNVKTNFDQSNLLVLPFHLD